MKVFAICPLCDDSYYGHMCPDTVTDSLDKAIDWVHSTFSEASSNPELHFHKEELENGNVRVWYGKYNELCKRDLSYGDVYMIIPYDLI